MNMETYASVAAIIAVLAIGIGVGDFLLAFNVHEVRRWGRALKLATPLIAGIALVVSGFDPTLTIKFDATMKIIFASFVAVAIFRSLESKRLHVLKPTD